MSDKIKICLFGCKFKGEDSRSVKLIADAAEKLGAEFSNIPKGHLNSSIINGELKFSCDDVSIEDQDAFIFRGTTVMIDPVTKEKTRVFPQMALFARYLKSIGKVVFDEYMTLPEPTYTKYTNAAKLVEAGIPNIPTWSFMKTKEVLKHINELPFPLILKPDNSAQGKGIMKFNEKDSFINFLEADYPSSIFFPNMLQQYIENDGDYRIVVLGDKVVVALKKHREENKIVANMSQGNIATSIEPSPELATLAVSVAQTLGMELAGVDIIEDLKTGKMYVLEANLSPQIYYSTLYSNIDIGEQIVKFVIDKVRSKS